MRKLLTLLIALATIVGISASSFAQLSMTGVGGAGSPSGGGSPSVYAGGSWGGNPAFPASTFATPSLDLGPVTATRYIVAYVYANGASSPNTGVLLGSTSMSKILTIDSGVSGSATELWAVQGATGEGSSAVVTVTPSCGFCISPAGVTIVVFDHINTAISSSNSANYVNTQNSPYAVGNVTIPSGGVGGFFANSSDGATVMSWNGTGVSLGTQNSSVGNSRTSNATSTTAGTVNASVVSLNSVTVRPAGIAFGP
jgi:hypothetical protein